MQKDCRARYYPSAGSTQEIAKEWVLHQDRTHHAACTDHQTAGRGRQGSGWHDEPGSSLLVSYVLWDEPVPQPAGILSLLTAVAAARSLELVLPDLPMVRIKYPNDLMLADRKAGGILIEVVNNTAIAGIGINLTQTAFPEPLKDTAVSLRQVLSKNLALPETRDTLLHQIWNHLHDELAQYRHDADRLWRICVERDGTQGRRYQILDLRYRSEGIALCLESDFQLCLQLPDGSTHSTYFVKSLP